MIFLKMPIFLLSLSLFATASAAASPEDLWDAARRGDAKAVEKLLKAGVDVNAKTRYGATALWFAVYSEHFDVVKVLVEHKVDLNAADTVWGISPLELAAYSKKLDAAKLLLRAGAVGADGLFFDAAKSKNIKLMQLILDVSKVKRETLGAALLVAPGKSKVREFLSKAGAKPLPKVSAKQRKAMNEYAGEYESTRGFRRKVTIKNGRLWFGGMILKAAGKDLFKPIAFEHSEKISFQRKAGTIVGMTHWHRTIKRVHYKSAALKTAVVTKGGVPEIVAAVTTPRNWPSFRGIRASGVADGQYPPTRWNVKKPHKNMWKTKIPGLGHACPIAWEDRVFITTAVSSNPKSDLKTGLYGNVAFSKDRSKHKWQVFCLNGKTGKVIWQRTANSGVPKIKRHTKATHANATPVTDGEHLVVFFASEGLYCYDLNGKLLWKKNLGVINAGFFSDPKMQWESASSPILWKDSVIVQCDQYKGSFIAAFSLKDGSCIWRTPRDEQSSWATPTIYEGQKRVELITNATNFIRGYDPKTGKELWRLGRNSQICVPTPIIGEGLIFVANGYRPIQPIYAIWPGAVGDITLKEGQRASNNLAWSRPTGSPYMPTPILYGKYLYTCSDRGIFACYEARTGERIYRERLPSGSGGYTASPIAADGRIYCTSETGDICVVTAGRQFELLAVNEMDEPCLATPAISNGMIFVRTRDHVYGIGRKN